MDDTPRTEYPALLANLQPNQAVHTLNDRVKRIHKVNLEVADWLQERRRVEDQYVMGLRRLSQAKFPNAQSELGVFQGPWARIVEAVDNIALTHHQFAENIERDVEGPLRAFHVRKDATNMSTMAANLSSMAKALDEAQHATEKLEKKGGKASTQKVDAASSKLDSATQQWESQAPYIFESLQALDESRINHLRDVLTQYQTSETDCAQRKLDISAGALSQVLEISTETEVLGFVEKVTAGRDRIPNQPSNRRPSLADTQHSTAQSSTGGSGFLAPPSAAVQSPLPESQPESPLPPEPKSESKLRRLGTILGGRRRQSVHAGIGLSPQKSGSSTFGRLSGKEGRGVSPRGSSSNLRESSRLGALAEAPDLPRTPEQEGQTSAKPSHEGTNGVGHSDNLLDSPVPGSAVNGAQESALIPTDTTTQAQSPQPPAPPTKDAEGYTIPAPASDPISEAQREAAGGTSEDADQLFKLSIQNKPIEEEDPEAKQAALSSVANSLKAGPAIRRSGTQRGRRDVRNTMYVPAPLPANVFDGQGEESPASTPEPVPMAPPAPVAAPVPATTASPSLPPHMLNRPAALASESSVAGTSDTQSVRSGNSLGSLAHAKHPELTGPGLNSSIIETVSVHYEGGEITSASIAGEIAFANNPTDDYSSKTYETIRINNFPSLDRIGPNRIFVQNTSPDQPDQYTLDVSHLTKTATAFSYRVFPPDGDATALGFHAPLKLNPAWKPQGDKLGLLIQYQLNPTSAFTAPVTLHNVVLVATYDGRATGAQTKPSGTHLKDRHLVYWRLGDVTLTAEPQKIVCRIVGAEGVEPTAGHVEARWEYAVPSDESAGSGISISRLDEGKGKGKETPDDDPFADAEASAEGQTWVDVPVVRKLVSGKYEGK